MEIVHQFRRLCQFQIRGLLLTMGIVVSIVILTQVITFPYENYTTVPSSLVSITFASNLGSNTSYFLHELVTISNDSKSEKEAWYDKNAEETDTSFETDNGLDKSLTMRNVRSAYNVSSQENVIKLLSLGERRKPEEELTQNTDTRKGIFTSGIKYLDEDSRTLELPTVAKVSKHDTTGTSKDIMVPSNTVTKKRMKGTSISHMNSVLRTSVSGNSMRPRWSSARDRELQHARWQIDNAPILLNTSALYPSLFRNASRFVRSYELMERVLKVYVYSEGEKPIFHKPEMRGIYASEGWFMKLMEGNKKFVVRDARKAHLFYLPFSARRLRNMLDGQNFKSHYDLENHLKNYIDTIARRYRFWNRTNGADHFLAACHDWAPKFTTNYMGSCIRALCNTNLGSGFKIGKDVSLPVTYIRTSENPTIDIGGKTPSERPILAFFAGGLHGYLRPILLKHWNNKVDDMKIFGPMSRDIEGKTQYREYMKSSKYCICARGYEVHTPRIVESIYYECVPVIISDNYVPPFFEVLDWEAFAVFVMEKDVPNLRNILLSIPEEKYLEMQQRVKMVQKHFLWHKKPEKYDLFHMTLHSIWYNRVFQVKPR